MFLLIFLLHFWRIWIRSEPDPYKIITDPEHCCRVFTENNTLQENNESSEQILKGVWHEIFDFRFF